MWKRFLDEFKEFAMRGNVLDMAVGIVIGAAGAPTLNVGLFIDTVLNFLIVAFAVFLLVRGVNRMKRRQAEAPEPPPASRACPHCLSTIPIKATRCAFCTSDVAADL